MKRRPQNEIDALVRLGKIRNVLLASKAVQAEIHAAADRVMRLTEPGTPARFLTLCAVAEESHMSSSVIADAILRAKRQKFVKPAPSSASPASPEEP